MQKASATVFRIQFPCSWLFVMRFTSLFLISICFQSTNAQKLDVQYNSGKNTLVFLKPTYNDYTISDSVLCSFGYCIFTLIESGNKGLIDSIGKLILLPQFQAISIENKSGAIQFIGLKNSIWYLIDTGGKAIIQPSKKRLFTLHSDTKYDYYFQENMRLEKPLNEYVNGKIIAIDRKTKEIREFDDTLMVDIFQFNSKNLSPVNYFYHGMLIHPNKDGSLFVRDLTLNRYLPAKDIRMVSRLRQTSVVIKTKTGFEFIDVNKTKLEPITFDRFVNDRTLHILYWKGNKNGAIIINLFESEMYSNYKVLPAEFDSISIIGMEIRAFKEDSLFIMGYSQLNPHNWRSTYSEVYKVRKNGELRKIEYLEKDTVQSLAEKDTFTWKDLLPNGFWLGYNYNFNNYGYGSNGSKLEFDDNSFEIGIGKYYYEKSAKWFPKDWFLGGIGIGYERRIPNKNNYLVDSVSARSFKPNYLNIRTEIGFGTHILFYQFFLHIQAGYSSNFTHHYFRPGIGISLGRLQIGVNYLAALGKEHPKVYQSGFYIRYIYTFNTWIAGEYKKPIDWDGRL